MMDSTIPKDQPLPLTSLRLLVPPLQLLTASMWQVLRKRDVMNYWNVAEFVSLVLDMVPELLLDKHRAQLNLGLRARYILELCRHEQLVDPEFISSHLDKMKAHHHNHTCQRGTAEEEKVVVMVVEMIQTLLKDPEERLDFFLEMFPTEYGPQYDSDLQTLFWEFLCRLTQLLPVPDLEQTMSWLGTECSLLEDFLHSELKPFDLEKLLKHHRDLGNLEQHVPPCSMGDGIISSLSAVHPGRVSKASEQLDQSDSLQGFSEETHTVSLVDDAIGEMITVTDYAEVELADCTDTEEVTAGHCYETIGSGIKEEVSQEVLPEKEREEEEVDEEQEGETQGKSEDVLTDVTQPKVNKEDPTSSQHKVSVGPHDCPHCEKKFKFASSLTAHGVIHTGERPHRCSDCGRCFSFRQSLDRHRHMHKMRRTYDCNICGETFNSSSARTEHNQIHMECGVYTCHQCNRKFNWDLGLARHLKTHIDNCAKHMLLGIHNDDEQKVCVSERNICMNPDDVPAKDDNRDPKDRVLTGKSRSPVPEHDDKVVCAVKVRRSGRKRKPTMKVQVTTLQKRLTANREKSVKVSAAVQKPQSVSSAEHSCGSAVVSSKKSHESSETDRSSAAFFCPKCPFQHSDNVQVQQHIDSFHSVEAKKHTASHQPLTDEDGRHSCPDCEKSFKCQSLLKAHKRIHTREQPFLCTQCGRRFSFRQSLERHKQTHKSGRKYECLICGEVFKSVLDQREHNRTHMENGGHLCSECGRAFAWKSALVRHLKIHSDDANKDDLSYRCPYCDLGFSCSSYLNRHLQTHQEESVHTCVCGKSFAYQAALTAHQRIHQKERPHMCTLCGKGFLYRGGLLSHMKIHSEEMPFVCSFCGKSFKRERNMKKHERFHTRENVFSCSHCDKTFVYKATLIRHELTHTGERPFLCSDCGKGFFSHAELLKHERFHTGHKPFHCPHCDKKFTQSCYLTIHLRYHTGVRPYSCAECDKSFLSANRLKRHQQTHSGEKPYLCGECGKGFRQAYNLKMHQRTHFIFT